MEKTITTHPIIASKPPHASKDYKDYGIFFLALLYVRSFFDSEIVYERNTEMVSHKNVIIEAYKY